MTLLNEFNRIDVLSYIDRDEYEAVLSPEASGEATLDGEVIRDGLSTKKPRISFDVRFDDAVDEADIDSMLDDIGEELCDGFKDAVDRVFELIDDSDNPIETIKSLEEEDIRKIN